MPTPAVTCLATAENVRGAACWLSGIWETLRGDAFDWVAAESGVFVAGRLRGFVLAPSRPSPGRSGFELVLRRATE